MSDSNTLLIHKIIQSIKELFDLDMVSVFIDYEEEITVTIAKRPKGVREYKDSKQLDEEEEEETGKIIHNLVIYKNPEAEAYFIELLDSHSAVLEITEEFYDIAIGLEQLIGLTNFIEPKYLL